MTYSVRNLMDLDGKDHNDKHIKSLGSSRPKNNNNNKTETKPLPFKV